MKILIIGGTRFVGRPIVEAALARGHTVTLFHRGQTNAELFPQVEHIIGNRDGGLAPLAHRRWDAVIDTCGYVPRVVEQSARLLRDAVEHYTFISTISVYPDGSPPGMDEDAPLAVLKEPTETITAESYGALKVLCEQVVRNEYADRALIVRPGLVVGPHDYTDRFTYWPWRIAQGGEVLAPGDPDQPIQFIDARDQGEWMVRLVEKKQSGVYNSIGPASTLSMRAFLESCLAVSGADARLTWIDEAWLIDHKVEPFQDLPLWVEAKDAAFHRVSNCRAIEAGLTFRPIAETIRDTLVWASTRPADHPWRCGLARERETELLREYHERTAVAA